LALLDNHGKRSFSTIAELIGPTLDGMGFELVVARFMKGSRNTTLQVMAEPKDRQRTMTIDDCVEISRAISAVLDVADPVAGAYLLEVGSPGIDRPLVTAEHFVRFAGQAARLELDEPVEGRRKFQGVLGGMDGEDVLIEVDGVAHRFPLRRIGKAKLTLGAGILGGGRRPTRRSSRAQRTG
jgi:ribosome maturation factor RimP